MTIMQRRRGMMIPAHPAPTSGVIYENGAFNTAYNVSYDVYTSGKGKGTIDIADQTYDVPSLKLRAEVTNGTAQTNGAAAIWTPAIDLSQWSELHADVVAVKYGNVGYGQCGAWIGIKSSDEIPPTKAVNQLAGGAWEASVNKNAIVVGENVISLDGLTSPACICVTTRQNGISATVTQNSYIYITKLWLE